MSSYWCSATTNHSTCFSAQVHDGADDASPVLVKACGSGVPDPSVLTSSGNTMFVRMLSDGSVAAKGFQASYITGVWNSVSSSCLLCHRYLVHCERRSVAKESLFSNPQSIFRPWTLKDVGSVLLTISWSGRGGTLGLFSY